MCPNISGANKTEKAIITISKAARVIQLVVDNIDNMFNLKDKRATNKKICQNIAQRIGKSKYMESTKQAADQFT